MSDESKRMSKEIHQKIATEEEMDATMAGLGKPQKLTIAYLKEQYPDPKQSTMDRGGGETYCVGGAFMLARGIQNHFPFSGQLWMEIQKYREDVGLPFKEGLYAHVTRLIRDNDSHNFDDAWKDLSILLNGGE